MSGIHKMLLIGAGALLVAAAAMWLLGGDDEGKESPGGESGTGAPATQPSETTSPPATAGETTAPTEPPTTASTAPPAPQDALTETCRNGREGFTLSYPAGWTAEADNPNWRCSLFDPDPFVIEPATEVPPTAVIVYVVPEPFSSTYSSFTDESVWSVLSTNGITIGSRAGSAIEIADTGAAFYEAGTRHYLVLVDDGDRTFVLETVSVVDGYRQNKRVVNAMAQTLEIDAG